MKRRILLLPLLLSEALAGNVRNSVRKRWPAYVNTTTSTTTPSATTSTTIPFTAIYATEDPSISSGTYEPPYTTDPSSLPDDPSTEYALPSSTCTNSVATYTGGIPTTVYVTVDGYYNVTVTASNVSITAPIIFETPLPPCETTVLWLNKTFVPQEPPPPPPPAAPPVWSELSGTNTGSQGGSFALPNPTNGPVYSIPPINGDHQTSTVIVTKKTPIPVVQSPSITGPPLTFQAPKTDVNPSLVQDSTNGQGMTTVIGAGMPAASSIINPSSTNPSEPQFPASLPRESNSVDATPGNPNSQLSEAESVASGLASIIASVINSPFATPSPQTPAPPFVPAHATPTIDGVAISIGPSNIVFGTQTIALPTASEDTVVVGSDTFTVRPSEIVGSSTTYLIDDQVMSVPTITQAPTVVTTNGVVITIGASLAIVSGTTYRIGSGAVSTTIVVNGQSIAIGSEGVAFSGASPTTIAPAMTIDNGHEIVIVDGLTISVDETAAVISGTTYSIGAGATTTTVTVGGKTATIGPGGVILPSTTVQPASVPTVLATTTPSASTNPIQTTSTGTSREQNSATRYGQVKHLYFLSWFVALLSLV